MGHYYCYIYDFNNKKWMIYNDSEVNQIEESKVL